MTMYAGGGFRLAHCAGDGQEEERGVVWFYTYSFGQVLYPEFLGSQTLLYLFARMLNISCRMCLLSPKVVQSNFLYLEVS